MKRSQGDQDRVSENEDHPGQWPLMAEMSCQKRRHNQSLLERNHQEIRVNNESRFANPNRGRIAYREIRLRLAAKVGKF